jgi:hypothetical protein
MIVDYSSPRWRRLRAARLSMDAHTCTAPGCRRRAVDVRHVRGRRVIQTLRSVCAEHAKPERRL